MYFIVYISSAVALFSPAELVALLENCRANNGKAGITGLLLYRGGNFMQMIEGEEDTVRTLYAKIERDPRHRRHQILLQGRQTERQFPNWSMAFRDLSAPELLSLPGYNEFLNTPLSGEEFSPDPTRCQKLLTTFKRTMT